MCKMEIDDPELSDDCKMEIDDPEVSKDFNGPVT